jgi:hypothetical protein
VYPEIWGINDAGGLLVRKNDYMWQNGFHYTALDSASRHLVPIMWNGGLIPGIFFNNATWFAAYRDSLYRLFPAADFLKPVVTLSANRNNNNDTVVISAHGNGPGLFTFARDAAFTDLFRPESADSMLKLHPSALTQRENDIYVRLRIGDSTATDNIRILKTFLSGIPGKDFDNKSAIIVYPNPFTTQFVVEGLDASKNYKLTLHALNGTVLYTTFASGLHRVTVVPDVTLTKGIYFLEVFDLSTQKISGGSILLKM